MCIRDRDDGVEAEEDNLRDVHLGEGGGSGGCDAGAAADAALGLSPIHISEPTRPY